MEYFYRIIESMNVFENLANAKWQMESLIYGWLG